MKAAKTYCGTGKIDKKYNFGRDRKLYSDRFRQFKVANNVLMKGNFVVPTADTAGKVARRIHRQTEDHVCDIKQLVAGLRSSNFFLPDFVGGLQLVAKE